jgi:hypothetical protein
MLPIRLVCFAAAAATCLPTVRAADPEPRTFTKASLGALATGWQAAKTGKGEGSVWKVVEDAGETDQGGGFVWRYRDADNYYVARYNPLENNYRFYKVVGGKRTQLATKEGVKAPAGSWHTLAVKMTGDRVECYLNDKLHLETKDATFAEPGKVGLWTKADAQTHFDLFQVKELAK